MRRAWVSPGKYVQGANELENLGYFIKGFGSKGLLIGTEEDIARVSEALKKTVASFPITLIPSHFSGKATMEEVARLREIAVVEKADCIIGLGGGRALDVAKGVAQGMNLILIPTIVASDAATSNLAVLYNEDGSLNGYHSYLFNPNIVLVDTQVILQAPPRFLVAGMGDALATFYEAAAVWQTRGETQAGKICGGEELGNTSSSLAAMAVAKACRDTILKSGEKAKESCLLKKMTKDFDDVVEANTLLSGLGFENGGLAAAHGIHDGFTLLPETHRSLHGEIVAFCLLVQFVLEERSKSEIQEVVDFMKGVGLPLSLGEIGLEKVTISELQKVADRACLETEPTKNLLQAVTPEMIIDAILTVNGWHQK